MPLRLDTVCISAGSRAMPSPAAVLLARAGPAAPRRKELPVKLVDKGKSWPALTNSGRSNRARTSSGLIGSDPRIAADSDRRSTTSCRVQLPPSVNVARQARWRAQGTQAGGRRFRPGLPVLRRSQQHLIDPAVQAISPRRGQRFPGGKAPRQIESVEGHRKEVGDPESVTFHEERPSLRVVREDLAEFFVAEMVYMKSLEPELRVPKPVRIEGSPATGDDAAGEYGVGVCEGIA